MISYQAYIRGSRAEFGCAKPVYTDLRTGWFSERASYLASARPVVVEDTGFSDVLPTGEGILPLPRWRRPSPRSTRSTRTTGGTPRRRARSCGSISIQPRCSAQMIDVAFAGGRAQLSRGSWSPAQYEFT
jgi:hypothetical protein